MRTVLTTLHSKFIHNSLALPCLAAYCGDACGELLIREFTLHEPHESILAQLLACEPEVLAFSVYIWNRRATLDLVDALAVARPALRIVLGGPEVSFDGPELFARHPGVSALVRGEGELPLRALLEAWQAGREPETVPRLDLRRGERVEAGPDGPQLAELDELPSPFAAGLVALDRGTVYYETSRGCPFRCSFCLSALDDRVRSFSMERIQSDLGLLMAREVPQVKLVDRTFNYQPERTREIFRFILAHNRVTNFHFEIAAHLLDEPTLQLLATVPAAMFQFEIGVQSTLENTLGAVNRQVSLEKLEANVRRLRQQDRVHLHLDLVAGLPQEGYSDFLASLDRVAALRPHQLQIEPVKLLPGSPLRRDAAALGLRFEPNPPYTVLATPELDFAALERIRELSRLMDLTFNAGCFPTLLEALAASWGSLARGLEVLADYWREQGLFRFPIGRSELFAQIAAFIAARAPAAARERLTAALAYDYACFVRVVPARIPDFFDLRLAAEEQAWVAEQVALKGHAVKGQGVKLQHFAAAFETLPGRTGRSVSLFFYLTRSGAGMTVEELRYPAATARAETAP